ncbi:MAG: serine/threonine protein kinase [Bifidobacteriaceae bacterium]|nr:serine/threonine protein kinase [Bifidobacteriaceae bacterium]
MSPARRPSSAPAITGFEPDRLLGQGGFADVFLYQQLSPRRRVAIKVLLPEALGSEALDRFRAEADAMAELSNHPHIVTIYAAGVADDGRPYLVMEHCPFPSLGHGLAKRIRSVADVLSIGVEISGAVETAHRSGILHRDIKPANILVTQYERPALTDFGIAVTLTEGANGAVGMSVPWASPESFGQAPWSGPQSDVWGLAATVYSLLARRAPFQVPGAENTSEAQIERIVSGPLTRIDRQDMPPTLHQVLATGMAKAPEARFPTAMAFGRALREVQTDLRLNPTPMVVLSDLPGNDRDDDDATDRTHLRAPDTTDPANREASTSGEGLRGEKEGAPAPSDTATIPPTQLRYLPAEPREEPGPAKKRVPVVVVIAAAVVLMGGAVTGGMALFDSARAPEPGGLAQSGSRSSPPALPSATVTRVTTPVPPAVVAPPTIAAPGLVGDTGSFEWSNPNPAPGDQYRVVIAGEQSLTTPETKIAIPLSADQATCVEIGIVRRDGTESEPARACAGPRVPEPSREHIAFIDNGTKLRFTWEQPVLGDGETFMWRKVPSCRNLGSAKYKTTNKAEATVKYAEQNIYIEAFTLRANGDRSAANIFYTKWKPTNKYGQFGVGCE